jgi:hypothetical protein
MNDSSTVRALVDAGVDPARAADFVADGLVVVLADHVLVMGETVEPLSGVRQVVVPFGGGPVLSDARRTAELRRLAARRHPEASVAVVRVPAGAPAPLEPPAGPARRMSTYVVADTVPSSPVPSSPVPPADWAVRPYRPDDRADVAELLARALLTGYAGAGEPADRVTVEGYVAGLLDQVGDGVTVYCAEHRGRFAGHATVVWDEDELTGRARPELLDLYVLEQHRGSPAAGLLTREAVRWSVTAGHPLRGHVAGGDDDARTVLERLCRRGWRQSEAYWVVDLP